jgi:hypothetical protein
MKGHIALAATFASCRLHAAKATRHLDERQVRGKVVIEPKR